MLMHLAPPKREEALAEHVEIKTKRLRAHGDKC